MMSHMMISHVMMMSCDDVTRGDDVTHNDDVM